MQWSASRMKLQSGNDSIEAGWMVNPPLYSNSDPHLYAKFTHPDDENWWLSIYMDSSNIPVGYWPKSLFTSLADLAAQVEWGGEINNPGYKTPDPDMGSGIKAKDDIDKCAVFFGLRVDKGTLIPEDTEIYEECKDYTVYDAGTRDDWGRLFFYGEVATNVEWGGEMSNPGLAEPDPYMGSGLKARKDPSKSAVFFHMVVDRGFLIPEDTEFY
uniref:Neprosin PEP catalytic domain-containing protein n=1 Tax=Chenopodium quinoa TaxID=63459 RepID=A0A803KM71_CHEQI